MYAYGTALNKKRKVLQETSVNWLCLILPLNKKGRVHRIKGSQKSFL
jgi:hypothetical protein